MFDSALHPALGLPVAEDGAVVMQHVALMKPPLPLHSFLQSAGYLCTTGFPWDCGRPALGPGGTSVSTIQT